MFFLLLKRVVKRLRAFDPLFVFLLGNATFLPQTFDFPKRPLRNPSVFEATKSPLKKGMLVMIPNFYVPLSRSRSEPFARKLGFQRKKSIKEGNPTGIYAKLSFGRGFCMVL